MGTEKLNAFTRFFDDSRSLDVMLQWLREAVRALPSKYANLLLFCTLTGMRGSEAVESVRLLNIGSDNLRTYYNPDRQILQHYLYPQIFIRGTKAIYISIVNDEIIRIAQRIENNLTQNGLKRAIARSSLNMRIKYCRKIHASYLHKKGISSDMIDALQGRISKSILFASLLDTVGWV
jgi:intergrase/recombinase